MSNKHKHKNKMKIAGQPVSYVRDGIGPGYSVRVVDNNQARVLHMYKPKPGQLTRSSYIGDFRLKKADVGQEVKVCYYYDGGITQIYGTIIKVRGNTTADIAWKTGA